MIRALWTAATGMESQQINQDVIANNLANINTVGFKKARADFQDLMYQVYSKAGVETTSGTDLPVGLEIGMGVKPVAVQKMFSQGDYQQTDSEFDLAIEGDGFFQIEKEDRTVYSRCGNFKVDRDGYLCNSDGYRLIPEVVIPADTVHFIVDGGGTWSAVDEVGDMLAGGRIELAKFLNPAGLGSLGRGLLEETGGSGEAITGNAGEDGLGTVSQHFLEMSNVNVVDEMVKMIVGQRAYEINSKAIQTADSMLQMVNNLKR
ncbi:MAG: flagellar basal-body rod protein FlgG [delta proteobacterium MLS_D]|jgi:flagellar basal-body rod protein FlgG|nr:MAG: flagellar basal-body rod protein FlgG [delta proteobacterium MLS_D]